MSRSSRRPWLVATLFVALTGTAWAQFTTQAPPASLLALLEGYDEPALESEVPKLQRAYLEYRQAGRELDSERLQAKHGVLSTYQSYLQSRAKAAEMREMLEAKVDEARSAGNDQLADALEQSLAKVDQQMVAQPVEFEGRFKPLSWDVVGMESKRREPYLRTLGRLSEWLTEQQAGELSAQVGSISSNVEAGREADAQAEIEELRAWIFAAEIGPVIAIPAGRSGALAGGSPAPAGAPAGDPVGRKLTPETVDPRYRDWYARITTDAERIAEFERMGAFLEAERLRAKGMYAVLATGAFSSQQQYESYRRKALEDGAAKEQIAQLDQSLVELTYVGLLTGKNAGNRNKAVLLGLFSDLTLAIPGMDSAVQTARSRTVAGWRQVKTLLEAKSSAAGQNGDDVARAKEMIDALDRALELVDGTSLTHERLAAAQEIVNGLWEWTLESPTWSPRDRYRVLALPPSFEGLDLALFDASLAEIQDRLRELQFSLTQGKPTAEQFDESARLSARLLYLNFHRGRIADLGWVQDRIAVLEKELEEARAFGAETAALEGELGTLRPRAEELQQLPRSIDFLQLRDRYGNSGGADFTAFYADFAASGPSEQRVRVEAFQQAIFHWVQQRREDDEAARGWALRHSKVAQAILAHIDADDAAAAQAELDRVWAWVFEGEIARAESIGAAREAATVELELVALDGERAPGTEATFRRLINASLMFNARGEVAMVATTTDGNGLWTGPPGRLRFLGSGQNVGQKTVSGQVANLPISLAGLDEDGRVIVQTRTRNVLGWIDDGGFQPIASWTPPNTEAVEAPVMLEGSGRPMGMPQVAGGRVAFSWGALYFGSLKGPQKIAEAGMHAPGTPTEKVTFNVLGTPQLSGDGRYVLFSSTLSGPGVTGSGFWLAGPEGVQLVTRSEGKMPDGEAFQHVAVSLGPEGKVLVSYRVASEPGPRLWYGRLGDLSPLRAPEGHMWVATPRAGGVLFHNPRTGDFRVVENGEVRGMELPQRLLQLQYTPGGTVLGRSAIGAGNSFAYWVGRPNALQLVLRSGDSVEVKPGDVRKIAPGGIRFAKVLASTNGALPLNDRGQALMTVNFEAVEGLRDATVGIFRVGNASGEIRAASPLTELTPVADAVSVTATSSATKESASAGSADSTLTSAADPSTSAGAASGASPGTAAEAGAPLLGAAGPLAPSFEGLRGRSYVIKFPKGPKFEATLNHKLGRCSVMDADFKDYAGTWSVAGTLLTMSFARPVFPSGATARAGRHEYSGAVALDGNAVVWNLGDVKVTLRELE